MFNKKTRARTGQKSSLNTLLILFYPLKKNCFGIPLIGHSKTKLIFCFRNFGF